MDKLVALEYFKTIARTRNISAAAEELGISQPALSNFVKRQEASVGAVLVDRSTIPVSITESGQAFIKYLENVESLGRELSHEIEDYETLQKGNLIVGGAVFFNVAYLPKAIAEFNKLYPGINIEIVDGLVPEITAEALAGRIDLFTTAIKSNEEDLCYEEMFKEKIFLCLPPEWEINNKLPQPGKEGYAELSKDDFKLLKDSTFIVLHEDQDIGRKMKAIFDKHGFQPQHVLTAGQTLTTLELTLAGAGISLITESTLNHYNMDKKPKLYLVNPEICTRTMYVAYPKHRYSSQATKRFIEVLLKHNK